MITTVGTILHSVLGTWARRYKKGCLNSEIQRFLFSALGVGYWKFKRCRIIVGWIYSKASGIVQAKWHNRAIIISGSIYMLPMSYFFSVSCPVLIRVCCLV